jgi:putative endonuclease
MTTQRIALGQRGESLAAEYLTGHGYTLIERNARTLYGEIDIVASLEGCTVFVEVKTRYSTLFGPPEEAVTRRKQEHMLASASAYIQAHTTLPDAWRIDVIAVQINRKTGQVEILHFENAVS